MSSRTRIQNVISCINRLWAWDIWTIKATKIRAWAEQQTCFRLTIARLNGCIPAADDNLQGTRTRQKTRELRVETIYLGIFFSFFNVKLCYAWLFFYTLMVQRKPTLTRNSYDNILFISSITCTSSFLSKDIYQY